MPESQEKIAERKREIDEALSKCGYDRVLKIITRDFRKYFLPVEIAIYNYLCSQTFGFNRNTVERSYRQIEAETGISKKTIIEAVKHLVRVGLIGKEIKGDSSCIFWVEKIRLPQKDTADYERLEKHFRDAHMNRKIAMSTNVAIDLEVMSVIKRIAKETGKTQKEVIVECCKTSPLYQRFAYSCHSLS